MKYISYKDRKAFATDLKTVYIAVNEESAMNNLLYIKELCYDKDPNVIESLNSQFRKITKTNFIFPTDNSLIKMLYLEVKHISNK